MDSVCNYLKDKVSCKEKFFLDTGFMIGTVVSTETFEFTYQFSESRITICEFKSFSKNGDALKNFIKLLNEIIINVKDVSFIAALIFPDLIDAGNHKLRQGLENVMLHYGARFTEIDGEQWLLIDLSASE